MARTAERRAGTGRDDARMTLVEHLTELRSRLIRAIAAVAIGGVVAWVLYPYILDVLIEPYKQLGDRSVGGGRLIQLDPLEGLSVRLKITAYVGIILAMPVILWQVWKFVTPGLYAHEKRYALPFMGSGLLLFGLGAGLAYWTLPKALSFLASIGGSDFAQFYSPAKYFTLVVYMMLAFGVGFEFPILLVFLQLVGLLHHQTLRRFRRYAIVGIAVVVAVVTPSGDPISMLALTIPMALFYEASIVAGRLIERRRRAAPA